MRSITAMEVMNSEVSFSYEGWPIKYLAEFFRKHNITDAPIVASDHQLVSGVSATDEFNIDDTTKIERLAKLKDHYHESFALNFHSGDLDNWSLNAEESCTVHQLMNPKVISVEPGNVIANICKTMIDNEIHRVFVAKDRQVNGVITTTNTPAALAGNEPQESSSS